jgi:hypothetical protein
MKPECFGSNPSRQARAEHDCVHCAFVDTCLSQKRGHGWVKQEILGVLAQAKHGLTGKQVYARMQVTDASYSSVRSYIGMLVIKGHAYKDGTHECPECSTNHTCYRISGLGRAYLAEKLTVSSK